MSYQVILFNILVAAMDAQTILSLLKGVKEAGENRWQALCPAHSDITPSLSVAVNQDKILVYCHAGCTTKAICSALSIGEKDLFKSSRSTKQSKDIVYDYRDQWGRLLYQVVKTFPKQFKQRQPGPNNTWLWHLKGVSRVLYRLPQLLEASSEDYVFIPEGEKDCETLVKHQLVATTNSGGAGKWDQSYNRYLFGRKVILLPDNDGPGHEHSYAIAKSLTGRVKELKIIFLDDLPIGGDVTDWFNSGGTVEQLLTRIKQAKPIIGESQALPIVRRLSQVNIRQLYWLWPNRFPMGKLSLIVGDPDLGKSFLSLYIAAQVSTGRPWADMPEEQREPANVIILTAEDDIEDTVAPRLLTHQADMERIITMQGVMTVEPETENEVKQYFNFVKYLPALEKAIEDEPECRLLIVDPITAYLGKTDSHKNAEVRGVLLPLCELTARKRISIIGISHLNKNIAVRSTYRVMGSMAFTAAARAVWAVSKDNTDDRRRLLTPCKCNLSVNPTSLAFRIIDGIVCFERDGFTLTADEALGTSQVANQGQDERYALENAKEFLLELLKRTGQVYSRDVFKEAGENKIAEVTLRRAKAELGIVSRKNSGGWIMELPADADKIGNLYGSRRSKNG